MMNHKTDSQHKTDRSIACNAYWGRKQAEKAAKKQQPFEAMDMLRGGSRIVASAHGAAKVSPIRDSRGKIDVLATAKAYGLIQTCPDDDAVRGARWDASDMAVKMALGQ